MLSLCQKIAVEASVVGMPQFQEMYDTAEILLHNWEAGLKCVVVTCSNECEEVTSSKEVAFSATNKLVSIATALYKTYPR